MRGLSGVFVGTLETVVLSFLRVSFVFGEDLSLVLRVSQDGPGAARPPVWAHPDLRFLFQEVGLGRAALPRVFDAWPGGSPGPGLGPSSRGRGSRPWWGAQFRRQVPGPGGEPGPGMGGSRSPRGGGGSPGVGGCPSSGGGSPPDEGGSRFRQGVSVPAGVPVPAGEGEVLVPVGVPGPGRGWPPPADDPGSPPSPLWPSSAGAPPHGQQNWGLSGDGHPVWRLRG